MEKPEDRSRIMRAVKGRDTGLEMIVRRIAHGMGYRYRLHRKDLPGKPDLVFLARRKVVFVHGCFWHGHGCVRGSRTPKTNRDYWQAKIARNKGRDAQDQQRLQELGWNVLVLWECEVKDREAVSLRLREFLETGVRSGPDCCSCLGR